MACFNAAMCIHNSDPAIATFGVIQVCVAIYSPASIILNRKQKLFLMMPLVYYKKYAE
jgi:hypothetical protein